MAGYEKVGNLPETDDELEGEVASSQSNSW